MKLQVAIDRVPLDVAKALAQILDSYADVIEIGTSLVKDYGNLAITTIKQATKHAQLLVDSKTIDEGHYEFTQGFKHGADYITVMGAASLDTLKTCYQVSEALQKTMVIDLLEVQDEKIAQISGFDNALYALHHSIDREDEFDAVATVTKFHQKFPTISRLAIAGGIDLLTAQDLAKQGIIEQIIVGSAITKAEDPIKAIKQFKEALLS